MTRPAAESDVGSLRIRLSELWKMAVWPIEGPPMIQCELKKRLNESFAIFSPNDYRKWTSRVKNEKVENNLKKKLMHAMGMVNSELEWPLQVCTVK